MKRSNLIIRLIPFLLFLLSCNNSENQKLIIGSWSGTEWLVNGKPSDLDAKGTFFTFDDKGAYTYEYSGNKENGTYIIEKDMLFATPKGENEMMVKIMKLTKDSLIFDMNRGGQPETLILIRQ
ncbi:MAG: lipocalin family protein [Bacteroidia bacterium]|nr:lipocalin family protein [Bacteroidia bacterium]